jgi:predicted ATPase
VQQFLLDPHVALVTLTGTGGVGKTRLSLEVAGALRSTFCDGVVFVSLAALPSADLVPQAVLRVLGLMEDGARSAEDILRAALGQREILLILDNFEHVAAASRWVASLLADCHRLKILVTSRVPLGVRGEQQIPIPPLSLPPRYLSDPDTLHEFPAVRLFVERVRALNPHFALIDANAPAISALCTRVDGLPLAIELIAARCKMLSPQALLARLSTVPALDLLSHGPIDLPDRQQTVRTAISWSYDLLAPAERRLFEQLACFVGEWTLEAAEQICADNSDAFSTVLEDLQTLINHNLVVAHPHDDGTTSFVLLEIIREYAVERLAVTDEQERIRHRHAHYYCCYAEQLAPHINTGKQAQVLVDLEQAQDNMRAALAWALHHGMPELVARICVAQHRFWRLRGQFSEAWRWLDPLLTHALPNQQRAKVLHSAGIVAQGQHDAERARLFYEEALQVWRDIGDQIGEALTLANYANILVDQGDYTSGQALLTETLRVFRAQGNTWQVATNLNNIGLIAVYTTDYHQARECYQESLRLYQSLGDQHGAAIVMANLGEICLLEQDYEEAEYFYRESLTTRAMLKNGPGVASMFDMLAHIAAAREQFERAAWLMAFAAHLRVVVGVQKTRGEERANARTAVLIRSHIDRQTIADIEAQGRTLTLEQAVAYALRHTI